MISAEALYDFKTHAAKTDRRECCGLLVEIAGKQVYWPCQNMANDAESHFIISGFDYAEAEDSGKILAVCHSHPYIPATPSDADKRGCQKSGLPWIVLNHPVGTMEIIEPIEYSIPLIGRQWSHGLLDCYTLIIDYYKEILGIELPDFYREELWWTRGQDLYRENYKAAGFVEVPIESMREHDIIFMRLRSKKDNHAGIYLSNNIFLHHPMSRLSVREVYGGWWAKCTTMLVRHKNLA